MTQVQVLPAGSDFTLPSEGQPGHLNEILNSTSLQGKYIQAIIIKKWELVKSLNQKRMKIVLEECLANKKHQINVFLFGDYAVKFVGVKEQYEVLIYNGMIERSTTYLKDRVHPFTIFIKDGNPMPEIQVRPPAPQHAIVSNPNTSFNTPSTSHVVQDPRSAKPKSPVKEYTYTQLADIKENTIVNVYGIVKFFKPPYKGRGPDYCMIMRIVDSTLDKDDKGLMCNLFMKDRESMPNVMATGDIIRMHRLKIQIFRCQKQGSKSPGFASLVFDGRNGATGYQRRSSTPLYSFNKSDEEKVDELRKWAAEVDIVAETEQQTLSSIKSSEYLDISVQIVATARIPAENCIALKVWDGTLCKSSLRWVNMNDHKFEWDLDLAEKAKGYIVDVWIYDDHVETASNLKVGQFIKIMNLHAAPIKQTNTIELVLHQGTSYGRGVIRITDDDPNVAKMKELFNTADQRRKDSGLNGAGLSTIEKQQQGFLTNNLLGPDSDAVTDDAVYMQDEAVCMQESATIISGHHDLPFSSISDVLPIFAPNFLRKIRAKVFSFEPEQIKEFVHLWCPECCLRQNIYTNMNGNGHTKTGLKITAKVPTASETQQARQKAKQRAASSECKSPRRSSRIQKKGAAQDEEGTSKDENAGTGFSMKHTQDKNTEKKKDKKDNESTCYNVVTRRKRKLLDEQNVKNTTKLSSKRGHVEDSPDDQDPSTEAAAKKSKDMSQLPTAGDKTSNIAATSKRKDTVLIKELDGKDAEVTIIKPHDGKPEVAIIALSGRSTVHDAIHMSQYGFRLKTSRLSQPSAEGGVEEEENSLELVDHENRPTYFECQRCHKGDDSQTVPLMMYLYNFRLILYDGTDKIEVIVRNEEAVTFLKCETPKNPHLLEQNEKLLEERIKQLCPQKISEADEDSLALAIQDETRPWLDCCIIGYLVRKKNDTIMRYQICDTALVLEDTQW